MSFQKLFLACFIVANSAYAAPLIITPDEMNTFKFELDWNFDGSLKRFQLDTGASVSFVSVNASTNSYASEGKHTSRGASGVPFECDMIRPGNLSIDDFKISLPKMNRCPQGAEEFNNLGADVLNGNVLELDFAQAQFYIGNQAEGAWSPKPLTRLSKGHLTLPVRIAGTEVQALFDTGAQITSVDSKFIDANSTHFKLHSEVTGRDVSGKPLGPKIYQVLSIGVNDWESGPTFVAAFEFGEDLRHYFGANTPVILGNNVITNANWLIDLKANQWDSRALPKRSW